MAYEESVKLNYIEIAKEFREQGSGGGGHGGGGGAAAGRFLNSNPQELTNGEETIIEEIFQTVSNYINKSQRVRQLEKRHKSDRFKFNTTSVKDSVAMTLILRIESFTLQHCGCTNK